MKDILFHFNEPFQLKNRRDKIQGVPENLLESREQYIVISRFLTRGVINAAKIVLFKFYN